MKDESCPIELPRGRGPLAPLTGQDGRALDAIVACWELYFASDEDGGDAAIAAVRALLPVLQPHCRRFARELIPYSGDWSHREKLWPLVVDPRPIPAGMFASSGAPGRKLPPRGCYFCPVCEADIPLREPCEHIYDETRRAEVRQLLVNVVPELEPRAATVRVETESTPEEPTKALLLELADALEVRADERNTVEEIKRRCLDQARNFARVAWEARHARSESDILRTQDAGSTALDQRGDEDDQN